MDIGSQLPLWSAFPFLGILLSIALIPLLAPDFWHHHFGKVSLFWALLLAVPFLFTYRSDALHCILHTFIIDYLPFLILTGTLYTIAGGIYLKGTIAGKPVVNLSLLLAGTFFASWIGTTGASMVMLRPLLRANAARKYRAHTIIFFIFLVGNIGGSLTPLGDPPLFLGFIHGVPFFWTFAILPEMLFTTAVVGTVYFIWDTILFRKEDSQSVAVSDKEPFRLLGARNVLFLAGVIAAVLFSGINRLGEVQIFGVHQDVQNLVRDAIILAMFALSLATTSKEIRSSNQYTWGPIREVAILFFGIFMTIIPALLILQAGERGALAGFVAAASRPWHYFWMSGILSSFLDNAPTYLTYFNLTLGKLAITEHQVYEGLRGVANAMPAAKLDHLVSYLVAISAGSVFMGANSYIGNAPNFMIKAIAEEAGVKMPSFFGYIFKYSIPVLIPTFILVTVIFFR
jgi:Na+/H+ antiporter NhaD/arsenite permease-like protein